MELDGLDLLSRSNKTMLEGIQRITADAAIFFRHACGLSLEGHGFEAHRVALRERSDAGMAQPRTRFERR
jgi:hypothetical protein